MSPTAQIPFIKPDLFLRERQNHLESGHIVNKTRFTTGVTIFLLLVLFAPVSAIAGDLVAYWSFDEGVGNVAGDKSGNKLDGRLEEGAEWTEGKVGNGIRFNGKKSR